MWRVLLHNDDYTTMEFVVEVLIAFFHKTDTEATHIMLTVHTSGAASPGVYTRDVAETKSTQVIDSRRERGYAAPAHHRTREPNDSLPRGRRLRSRSPPTRRAQRRHEYVTLEHLLYALLFDGPALVRGRSRRSAPTSRRSRRARAFLEQLEQRPEDATSSPTQTAALPARAPARA